MVRKEQHELLDLEEFSQRFVERMVRHPVAANLHGGVRVRQYAEGVAHAYWIEANSASLSPEDSADSDMSYWGK